MKNNKITLLILLIIPFFHAAYADDCEPNGLGGSFCIKNNGVTSDSMPNEFGGQDTMTSEGKFTSTLDDGTGTDETLSDDGLSANKSVDDSSTNDANPTENDSLSISSEQNQDDPLIGRNWNSAP